MQHSALRIYKGMHGAPPDERPLVSVGEVPDTFIPVVPTLVDEPETWVLTHRHDYTLYGYQVTQEDATYRLIYLLVPAGIRLYADINPYGLLSELWEVLKSQGDSHALFEEQLALIMMMEHASDMHLPVMEGERPASFCADSRMQVKALLMFSLYPQLAGVSRLEIGLHCASTISLPIKANTKKEPQLEPIVIQDPDIIPTKPSGKKKTEVKQSGWKRYMRGKLFLYGFCLTVVAAVIGTVLIMKYHPSGSSNVVPSPDTLVAEKKPVIVKEKPEVERDDLAASEDNDKVDTVRLYKLDTPIRDVSEKKETDRMRARREILELVNEKKLIACRQHYGWKKYLNSYERIAVETIFSYSMSSNKPLTAQAEHRIKRLIDDRSPFRSFKDILEVRDEIIKIIHSM